MIRNQVFHNQTERTESNSSLASVERAPVFDKRALGQSRRTGGV